VYLSVIIIKKELAQRKSGGFTEGHRENELRVMRQVGSWQRAVGIGQLAVGIRLVKR